MKFLRHVKRYKREGRICNEVTNEELEVSFLNYKIRENRNNRLHHMKSMKIAKENFVLQTGGEETSWRTAWPILTETDDIT